MSLSLSLFPSFTSSITDRVLRTTNETKGRSTPWSNLNVQLKSHVNFLTGSTEVFIPPFKLNGTQGSVDHRYGNLTGSVLLRVETYKMFFVFPIWLNWTLQYVIEVSRVFGWVTGTTRSLWRWRYVRSLYFPDVTKLDLSVCRWVESVFEWGTEVGLSFW